MYRNEKYDVIVEDEEIFQPLADLGYIIIYSNDEKKRLKIDAPENYSLLNHINTTDASVTIIGENEWTNKTFKINDIKKIFIGPYTNCVIDDKQIINNISYGRFIYPKRNIYKIKVMQSEK